MLASPNLKRVVEQCLNKEEAVQLKKAVFQLLYEETCDLEEEESKQFGTKDKEIVLQASAYIAFGTKKHKEIGHK